MNHQLDTRKLLCPLPVIRVQDKINTLQTGDTLEVLCTDPGVLHDIPAWCRVHGHQVLETKQQGREIMVKLEVCKSNSAINKPV